MRSKYSKPWTKLLEFPGGKCVKYFIMTVTFTQCYTIGIQEQRANLCNMQTGITIIHIDTTKELIGFAKTVGKLKQKKDN